MMHSARRRLAGLASSVGVATALFGGLSAPAAQAQGLFSQPKYAAIVEDANTGEVLYSLRADALRYPASISKVMTLYLTFEALATGRLSLSDRLVISPHAYSMAPSKVSTHPGEVMTVAQAIPTVTVHSANDVAVALAERIGGSEAGFARLMTLRAHELGMTSSTFVNASGLPDSRQIVSARDIATLCRAIMRDYPQYYGYFGLKSTEYGGKLLLNHNHLVARMPGVDGLKTGFTNAAGFNLAASGVRDGHRLITVVLGGPSTAARDENVEELLDAGFSVLTRRAAGQRISIASMIAEPTDMYGPMSHAPVEEGSGDQPSLRVEVQPSMTSLPTLTSAREVLAQPAKAEQTAAAAPDDCAAKPTRHRRGRRHAAAAACAPAEVVAKAKSGKSEPAKAEREEADAAAKPACAPRRHHRHAAACEAGAVQTASAAETGKDRPQLRADKPSRDKAATQESAKDGDEKGGGYMIQVGAYKSHALAQGQVQKVAGLVSGVGKVEQDGGNYRARFRGLSQAKAKAACRTLSAKGHACMVMDAS